MRLAAILLTIALLAAGAAGQDAPDCEAPLGELRGQLADAQARAAAAEASSGTCTSEAYGLREKLQQAEAAAAELASKQAAAEATVAELAAKLAAAEAAAAAAPDAAAIEAEKADLRADAKIARDLLGACQLKRTALQEQYDEKDLALAMLTQEKQTLDSEVESLRRNTEQARIAVMQCMQAQQDLESAWLPAWAAASVGPALEQAGQAAARLARQGSASAAAAWAAHGAPALAATRATVAGHAERANAAIEAKLGDSWPKAKSAAASAASAAAAAAGSAARAGRRAALAVWHSDAAAAVRPALAAAARRGAAEGAKVRSELEDLLISLLARHNSTAPLARRPYVTYIVYGALVVPLVAFGLPLLGLRRARAPTRAPGAGGAPLSTKKKKNYRPAARAH